ncbi:MAG: putative Ig domain-containing protein [Ilumatobacteraceae bacterium]|nr:putative Ig domain-containing protein [Ilumatobacteraceae bacterium]
MRRGVQTGVTGRVLLGCLGVLLAGCSSKTPTTPQVQAPTGLNYSLNPASYPKGVAIAPNTPSSSGGAVSSYAVNPALPAGLTLNTTSGVITGTPETAAPATNYTVSATNAGGSASVGLSIAVTQTPLSQLAITTQPATTSEGVALPASVRVEIRDAGGAVVTSATNAVTLAIGTNPGNGTLGGTLTTAAVAGVATFPGLSINQAGTG